MGQEAMVQMAKRVFTILTVCSAVTNIQGGRETGSYLSCGKIKITGDLRTRDYHSAYPEGNVFDLTCKGGCIKIEKVVHDCDGNRMPTPKEMDQVKSLCENHEHCRFIPAPSFFGPRKCKGVIKTWVHYRCLNHVLEITNHQDGNSCYGPITRTGELRTRDYHSPYPEGNFFDLTCQGGCIKIEKVVHDCDGNRMPTPAEMQLVKGLCEKQESCSFVPAPSFFGPRSCKGVVKTWLHWRCLNHKGEITNHKDGKSCDGKITRRGELRTRDYHSACPEGNFFDLTCKGGCITIEKVVHDCDGNRMPTPAEMQLVKNLCEKQESCSFVPAPSFFGPRKCKGVPKTWVHWRCLNHQSESTNHVDGNSCYGKITKTGELHTKDFHSAKTEGNLFDLTCKGG